LKNMLNMGLNSNHAKWICSFLRDREQRVRMPNGCLSNWKAITCGTPQGTLMGPVAFLAMINGAVAENENRLKYVDDLTIFEGVPIEQVDALSQLQATSNQLTDWANQNKMVLNADKCQVMHIFTAKKPLTLPDIKINGNSLPVVQKSKLLGITLTSDMSWQTHVEDMVARGSRALYMLHVLNKFHPPSDQMLAVYITYIRPLLEYGAPVFHAGLTIQQAKQIERVQMRALKIIGGYDHSYQQLMQEFKLETLATRRETLSLRLGKQILRSEKHRELLPQERQDISGRTTRHSHNLQPFRCGMRLRKSAIPYMTVLLNSDI